MNRTTQIALYVFDSLKITGLEESFVSELDYAALCSCGQL